MIKELVQWVDVDGKPTSKTFFFNLTEFEVAGEMELEVLHARFQKFQDNVIADDVREMTPAEVRELLDMIKVIIRYAYGERRTTPEGTEFWKEEQDPNIWRRFVASGGFNAFIWYLFRDAKRANHFMSHIWPESYQEGMPANDIAIPAATDEPSDSDFTFMENVKDYSLDYLLKCTDAEFRAITQHFTEGRNVPFELLVAGGRRTSNGPKDDPAEG